MNEDIRLNVQSRLAAGILIDFGALPVVHARPEHGQGGLALDQCGERQGTVVILLDGFVQGLEVVVLIGQRVGQLVGDDGLVLVLVELRLLAEEPLQEPGGLLRLGLLGLLDQVHRLGPGVVEGGDLLGVDLCEGLLEVEVARQQAECLHGHLVGAELLGRHVLLELFQEERLQVLALGDVALDLVEKGNLPQLGEDLLESALVADDGLGGLALIGQSIPLLEQLRAGTDGRVLIVGRRRARRGREDGQDHED